MTSCGFLVGLSEITKGKKPDEVWLPLASLKFEHNINGNGRHKVLKLSAKECFLNDMHNNRRSIKFKYGRIVKLKFTRPVEYIPLSWEVELKPDVEHCLPIWWPENGIGDLVGTSHWSAGWIALNSIYYEHIKEAGEVLGRGNEGSLAHLFSRLIGWMEIAECSKERRMIFQAAILCRIHAWMGSDFGDKRSKEILSVFVSQAWQDPTARQILTNDILTVDWMLAWLHAPGFNADDK
jgi:hypothetical protein